MASILLTLSQRNKYAVAFEESLSAGMVLASWTTGVPPSSKQEDKVQTQPRLIGFTGLKGSGKDTAGQVFTDHGWHKLSFAQPLKLMLRDLMRLRGCTDPERYTDGDRKEFATPYLMGKTARHAMQTLGTEWGRNLIDDALWIDTFERVALRAIVEGHGVVVTDVRFPNEVEAIKRLGGRVFRVNRGKPAPDLHPSEAQVLSLDVTDEVYNNYDTARDFQVHIESRFF